jgi:hypothetical protein
MPGPTAVKGRSALLTDAMHRRQLVRFSRRFESSRIHGYVLDVGTHFFMLLVVSDRIQFDGFDCFRIRDVRNVKPAPYAAFVEAALKKRGARRPPKPRIRLANVEELLLSAARSFPLITIHREQVDPDACWIGSVLGVKHGRVSMLEIGPDAVWDHAPEEYRISEITRVNFGGDYETALRLVGGDP